MKYPEIKPAANFESLYKKQLTYIHLVQSYDQQRATLYRQILSSMAIDNWTCPQPQKYAWAFRDNGTDIYHFPVLKRDYRFLL